MNRNHGVASSLFEQSIAVQERAVRMYATSKIEGIPAEDKRAIQARALKLLRHSFACYRDAKLCMAAQRQEIYGYRITK